MSFLHVAIIAHMGFCGLRVDWNPKTTLLPCSDGLRCGRAVDAPGVRRAAAHPVGTARPTLRPPRRSALPFGARLPPLRGAAAHLVRLHEPSAGWEKCCQCESVANSRFHFPMAGRRLAGTARPTLRPPRRSALPFGARLPPLRGAAAHLVRLHEPSAACTIPTTAPTQRTRRGRVPTRAVTVKPPNCQAA